MNSIDDIRHDLSDATFSVAAALDLLSCISGDSGSEGDKLSHVIHSLQSLKGSLEQNSAALASMSTDFA